MQRRIQLPLEEVQINEDVRNVEVVVLNAQKQLLWANSIESIGVKHQDVHLLLFEQFVANYLISTIFVMVTLNVI